MFKKIANGIMLAISVASAVIISAVAEVPNWWELTKPWVFLFFGSIVFTWVINNGDLIRRYTYPTRVCVLAWAYGHKILRTELGRQSYSIYRKHKNSYSKLFEVTQCLYDMVALG